MEIPPKNAVERRTIRLSARVATKLDELAEQENRSFNNMVETMIKRQLEYYGVFY